MWLNDTEELTVMRFSFYPPGGLGALDGHFGVEQPGVLVRSVQLGRMAVMACINSKHVNDSFSSPH